MVPARTGLCMGADEHACTRGARCVPPHACSFSHTVAYPPSLPLLLRRNCTGGIQINRHPLSSGLSTHTRHTSLATASISNLWTGGAGAARRAVCTHAHSRVQHARHLRRTTHQLARAQNPAGVIYRPCLHHNQHLQRYMATSAGSGGKDDDDGGVCAPLRASFSSPPICGLV